MCFNSIHPKYSNTPEESKRIVDLLLNGNKILKSENTESKEKVARQAIKDIIEPFMKEHLEFVW